MSRLKLVAQFTTSLYTDVRHQIHSYNDETWQGVYPSEAINEVASLPLLNDPTSPEEFRSYQKAASEIQGAMQLPDRLEVSRLDDEGTPKGFLLRSPEPIDWKTTKLTVSRAPSYDVLPVPPQTLKLIDVSLESDQGVSLLLRETADISGYAIEYRRSAIAGFAPTLVGRRFTYDLTKEAAFASLNVIDSGDAGLWQVQALGLMAREIGERWSTVVEKSQEMKEGVISTQLQIAPDSKAALLFRYHGPDTHYRLSLGTGDGKQLVKLAGSAGERVLWRDNLGIPPDTTQTLRVELGAGTIRAYLNTVPMFAIEDPDPGATGRIGLAAWGHAAAATALMISWGSTRPQATRLGGIIVWSSAYHRKRMVRWE